MKVILIKDIEKLGKCGEVVEVRDGYARNYLIPQGLALHASKENFQRLERIKEKERKLLERKKKQALQLKEKIEKLSLTIPVEVKEGEDIYGSVGSAQISKLLKSEGIEIEENKIILAEPIRKLGVYSIEIELHPQVKGSLRVWVVKK
ncbi:MAG: 50S ribosomal protein L9 [Candidatus Omnitrophica bacterium]|nr:50S ribosomal protein L9 [Candidatus Omnitrophota bacterium]